MPQPLTPCFLHLDPLCQTCNRTPTDPSSDSLIETYKRLREQATPGPWYDNGVEDDDCTNVIRARAIPSKHGGDCQCHDKPVAAAENAKDSAFIVFLVNNADRLVEQLEAAQQEIERLRRV